MAELVDALVSGTSGSDTLEVRVFLSAPVLRTVYSDTLCLKVSFGVVAQLIERYVRIVEVVGLSPISSTRFFCYVSLRGYGGMVDAEDLKSFGHCDRVGSSPTIPTTFIAKCFGVFLIKEFGCVAQLVRALRSHRRGRWFESNHIHQILFFV